MGVADGEIPDHIKDVRKCDIWGIGVVLWEFLAGLPLWKEARKEIKIYNDMLRAGGFKEWFGLLTQMPQNRHFPEFVPADAVDLMDQIFRHDPDKRISIDGILSHPFLEYTKVNPPKKQLSISPPQRQI